MDDICRLSADGIARATKAGDVSAEEVISAILTRIEEANPKYSAFTYIARNEALTTARSADIARRRGDSLGPLHGVPVSIKDVLYTRGMPTTAGSRLYAGFRPVEDAIVVQRLVDAGAIVIGKTATCEFCHKTVTVSPLYGVTPNPWDQSLTAGGSSGGAAVAVATGMGPLAIGTDGGGSIRLPAALCGVVGFKPSYGRVPQYPGFAGWDILGHIGPLARRVADIRTTMSVLDGADPRDPLSRDFATLEKPFDYRSVRLAVANSLNGIVPEPAVQSAFDHARDVATEIAGSVIHVQPACDDPERLFSVIVACELASALNGVADGQHGVMDPSLVKMLEFGRKASGPDLARALSWRLSFARDVSSLFEENDLLMLPTAPVTAFPADILGPRTISGKKTSPFDWFSWTWPFNVSGHPAISIPVRLGKEMPVGIQIVGPIGKDNLVLDFAEALQSSLGTAAGLEQWPE